MVGKTFSHYRILGKLGAGGMGEVYLARDEQLGRQVAVKVLPEAFACDPERVARLKREAQVLASLNHPNIAATYGLEQTPECLFLVLELVPGETLAERMARPPLGAESAARGTGETRLPLPLEEVLGISKQVAEGLEAAHEKGIIHRDLKPGNLKLTPEEKVKILDFGLAKSMTEEGSASSISDSPTLATPATREGVLLGTAGYMSPEQARGKAVDRRADIWAFGCVVFEMLSGKQAFEGDTASDALAAVLRGEPDWNAFPDQTPRSIRGFSRAARARAPAGARLAGAERISRARAGRRSRRRRSDMKIETRNSKLETCDKFRFSNFGFRKWPGTDKP